MAFLIKGHFPEMEPTLDTKTASLHLETSFVSENKNNDPFSLIWVGTAWIIKKEEFFHNNLPAFLQPYGAM